MLPLWCTIHAYNVFDIVRGGEIVNHRYRNKKGWQRALQTLGDLGLSMLVVILVYLSYQNINLFLVGLLGCPQKRWWWLANPSDLPPYILCFTVPSPA